MYEMYLSCNKVILSILNPPFLTDLNNLICVMKREMCFIPIYIILSNSLVFDS